MLKLNRGNKDLLHSTNFCMKMFHGASVWNNLLLVCLCEFFTKLITLSLCVIVYWCQHENKQDICTLLNVLKTQKEEENAPFEECTSLHGSPWCDKTNHHNVVLNSFVAD